MKSLPKLTTKPYAAKSTTGSSSGTAILSIFQRSPNKNASYRQGSAAPRYESDRLFWKASETIHLPLATYVRAHRDAFLNAAPAGHTMASTVPTQRGSSGRRTPGRRDKTTLRDRIAALPHWARVTLAARCARLTLPEFRRAWPDALPKRLTTVQRCLAAADQSASQGRRCADLQELTTDAGMVVGAAIIGLSGSPFEDDDEPRPVDGNLAVIASKAARVALMAAEAAHNGAEKSASYAAEAVSGTIDLSEMIESKKIQRRVAQAVNDLEREAAQQRWTDESAVSPTVFTKPSKPRRPWWKFW